MAKKKAINMSPTIVNRKAAHDYHFEEKFVAGVQLTGTEIKSIRQGKVQLQDGYCLFEKGELYLRNVQITPYEHSAQFFNHEPDRSRKLLLNRKELDKISKALQVQGTTVIPTRLFFNDRGYLKIEIAVAKGKKMYDKRNTVKEREAKRDLQRNLKW